MQWHSRAIILSSQPYGEGSYVVKLLTESEGIFAGMVRVSRKNRSVLEQGNIAQATWKARLEEHLGALTLETIDPISAYIIHDGAKLKALSALSLTLLTLMPERDPHAEIFTAVFAWLQQMKTEPDIERWLSAYVSLEITLLKDLGFALDLSRCADTGSRENLAYVSPKTGRAISEMSGLPYHDRLLSLPAFLLPQASAPNKAEPAEILDGLRLTRYFLEQFACRAVGRELPYARREMELFCLGEAV